MSVTTDRVEELFGGEVKRQRLLVSPEGVPLHIVVAATGDRLIAVMIDMMIIFAVSLVLAFAGVLLFQSEHSIGYTLMAFFSFIVQNFYFIYFELAWQGRTPGKKHANLRVINRTGGELTPGAIVARNLTRQVEMFLPIGLWLSLAPGGSLATACLFGWVALIGSLPLWNRDGLRAGDLIGGTQVIAMPKRVLLSDLADRRWSGGRFLYGAEAQVPAYRFTPAQLSIYGAFELQVLEEFLRRPDSVTTERGLQEVYKRIRRKIGYDGDVPDADIRRWLTDFYTAEREELERNKLYGTLREDKTGAVRKP
ncbi:MAG: RDD family protein [Planctomycetaceae bacterium]|nr:RDD family protein [Planctomycetaceae bacterium]